MKDQTKIDHSATSTVRTVNFLCGIFLRRHIVRLCVVLLPFILLYILALALGYRSSLTNDHGRPPSAGLWNVSLYAHS